MLEYTLIGIGFIRLVEGLFYFFLPQQMKNMMKIIETMEM